MDERTALFARMSALENEITSMSLGAYGSLKPTNSHINPKILREIERLGEINRILNEYFKTRNLTISNQKRTNDCVTYELLIEWDLIQIEVHARYVKSKTSRVRFQTFEELKTIIDEILIKNKNNPTNDI